jgi:hypothetical protein
MKNTEQAQTTQTHNRAIVWIDHLQAKIFAMGITGVTPSVVHAHLVSPHLHHKANTIGSGHVPEDPAFLEQVAKSVGGCSEVMILGPGTEKTALKQRLETAYPAMMLRVESSDHPTDAEIIAIGRKHFRIE